MSESKIDLLIIGIGNAGRQDDGLGWAFLDAIADQIPTDIALEYRYQLNIEDAELISSASQVLFVDAKTGADHAFEYDPCLPKEHYEFTSHALEPEVILALCNSLFQSNPIAHILTISGQNWELEEGLSDFAQSNLEKATEFFKKTILELVDYNG